MSRFRSKAVELVDRYHGYTYEFSASPKAHEEEYDEVEKLMVEYFEQRAEEEEAASRGSLAADQLMEGWDIDPGVDV